MTEFSTAHGAELIAMVRRQLLAYFGGHAAADSYAESEQHPALLRTNVSIRTRGVLRGSMSGEGATLAKQLRHAVERVCRDRRFTGPIVAADLPDIRIEVSLQLDSTRIPPKERSDLSPFQMGLEGLEVACDGRSAYYKPSVALTSGFETPQKQFSALCKKAGLDPEKWKEPSCDLRRSTWMHFAESEDGPVALTALKSSRPLTLAALRRWAASGAGYLSNNQEADGAFTYLYDPLQGVAVREKTNSVRASGCAYAMALAASTHDLPLDAGTARSAERAIREILRRAADLPNGGIFIQEDASALPTGKLGTTALLLVALLCPSMREQFREESELLMRAVRDAQRDDGLFSCSFGDDQSSESQINYFPGQALLALVMSAAMGDEESRAYYRRGFAPYRDHFRREPNSAFIGWHADVWSRAAELESNQEFADFVFEQIDWLLPFQLDERAGLLYKGGFSFNGSKPNVSSIVYAEAIARAARLAKRFDEQRAARYARALLPALEFCSTLRLDTDQSSFFPFPDRAIGGVIHAPTRFQVRSDHVQHLMTLAIATIESGLMTDHGLSEPGR